MNGGCDLIVTRDWSRWGRDVIGNIKFVRMLKEVGVEVHAVSDGSWSFEENSGFMIGLHSLISEQESNRISIKVKAGQMVSRNNHILYGNNLFGYKLCKENTKRYYRRDE